MDATIAKKSFYSVYLKKGDVRGVALAQPERIAHQLQPVQIALGLVARRVVLGIVHVFISHMESAD